jgi:hypothetical protein
VFEIRGGLEIRIAIEQRPDHRLISEQPELQVRQTALRNLGAGQDHFRTAVAAHDIE